MQAENLVLYNGRKWQIIEEVRQVLPHVGISILAETLVIEAVHLRDLSTLVIAPQNGNSVLEAHLQTD